MGINDDYLKKLAAKAAEPSSETIDLAAGEMPDSDELNTITDGENRQTTSEPSTTTAQADTELNQLRADLAAKAAEIDALKAAQPASDPVQDADDDIALYDSEDERQDRIDALGEDLVNAEDNRLKRLFNGMKAKYEAKLTPLQQEKQLREQSEASAVFVRAAGNDALKTFNDPKFQEFAKGERLGRKSLFDELNDIVSSNDLNGIEFLIEQASAFNGANKSVRKAQIGVTRNTVATASEPANFNPETAKKLQQAIYSKRFGSDERKKAQDKYERYLETTN